MLRRRPVVIANEIRLKRSQHSGPFLVVEGRDDRLFMERFTSQATCNIIVAEGKQSVCEVIQILDDDNFPGILGLVDADFDRIAGSQSRGPNIVMPEYHDLEMMLMCSPALDRILVEFGSQSKLDNLGRNVLEVLISTALPIGWLRLYSLLNELNLRFDGLSYSAWIDHTSLQASLTNLIQEVKNRSQRHDLSSELLEAAILQFENAGYQTREICSGSDLVEILSIGLRSALGTNQALAVNGTALRRSLRLAYSEKEFSESSLGKAIQCWEARTAPFQVLRK